MDLYREQIIEHYKNPRNSGELEGYTHEAELKNLSCGDEIKIQVKLNDSSSILQDIRFTGRGCAICIAAASLMSEEVKGKTIDEIRKLGYENIERILGIKLSPSRIKCAHLGLLTLQEALENIPKANT